MKDFKCERNKMEVVKNDMKEVNDILSKTYEQALSLAAAMGDVNCWEGEAHQVAMAFLDLTMQYHQLLTETGNAPVKQAYDDLEKYLKTDDVFYDEWENYQKLMEV